MSFEDPGGAAEVRAAALLAQADDASRGAVKRLAAWLDTHGDAPLRQALVALGRRRGAEIPDEAVDWPGKRLLRLCRGHEAASRTRTNPIMRDEDFTCAHCGAEVPAHGRTARDHCPHCLRSLHVDVVPGDREAACGGLLDPIGVSLRGGHPVLTYRCRRCGAIKVNRAVLDGDPPDDWSRIAALSAGEEA